VENTRHRLALVSGGIKLGGATTFLLNLGGELVRRGVPVLVVSLEHENPLVADFESSGIPAHVEDERTTIFEDRLSTALQVIRRFQPTAVVSCLGPSSYEILRYVPAHVTRLAMLQSDFPEGYDVLAAYAPFFEGTVGVSHEIRANFQTHSVLGKKPAYYLPYGIQIPAPCSWGQSRLRGEAIRILYFGRLCRPQKRVELLPQILHRLNAAAVPFHWTIAGDGPEATWLQTQMASAQPQSTVQFAGAVAYREVPNLLDAHDVFLLVSDHEGLPLSLLEAMAHGLVPVVSNLPSGIPEVVNGETGILVDVNDVSGYANGIAWLWQNPDAAASMSEKAAVMVRTNFSASAMTDRWVKLLDQLHKTNGDPWPQHFRIKAPLLDSSIRYSAPLRILRRQIRLCLGRLDVRRRSTQA
jgi:colanic acid/amylovoran biosynthesis glycosyltransferase